MPASPRIWPSIRFSLFRHDVLISWRIELIYPPRVSCSRETEAKMADGDQTQGAKDAASGHDACRHHDHHHHDAGHDHATPAASCCSGKHDGTTDPEAKVAIDPVCGMKVKRATAKHRFEYQGNEYLFCCARCRERFQT